MVTLPLQSSGITDLSGLSFSDVENIYRKVEFDFYIYLYAAVLFGAVLGILRVLFLVQKISFKGGSEEDGPTISDFLQLLLEKWKIGLVILAIPFAFTGIDYLLSALFNGISASRDGLESDFFKAMAKEIAFLMQDEPSIWDLSPGDLIDYTASLAIQPLVILIDQWVLSLALLYRFFFLGLVKMTSGFAVVSLLNDNTKTIFFTWFKSLLICYLLIPAFLLANAMMEGVKEIYLTNDNFNWYISILIIVIAGKLLLFSSSKILLWRIL